MIVIDWAGLGSGLTLTVVPRDATDRLLERRYRRYVTSWVSGQNDPRQTTAMRTKCIVTKHH